MKFDIKEALIAVQRPKAGVGTGLQQV